MNLSPIEFISEKNYLRKKLSPKNLSPQKFISAEFISEEFISEEFISDNLFTYKNRFFAFVFCFQIFCFFSKFKGVYCNFLKIVDFLEFYKNLGMLFASCRIKWGFFGY